MANMNQSPTLADLQRRQQEIFTHLDDCNVAPKILRKFGLHVPETVRTWKSLKEYTQANASTLPSLSFQKVRNFQDLWALHVAKQSLQSKGNGMNAGQMLGQHPPAPPRPTMLPGTQAQPPQILPVQAAMASSSLSLPFTTLDVLTQRKYAGIPVAIVDLAPSTPPLSQAQRQAVVREFNLSSIAFLHLEALTDESKKVLGHDLPVYHLDICTAGASWSFAGHAIFGAAVHLLRDLGLGRMDENGMAMAGLQVRAGNEEGQKLCVLEVHFNSSLGVFSARVPHDFHAHKSSGEADWVFRAQPGLLEHAKKLSHTYGVEKAVQEAMWQWLPGEPVDLPVVSPERGINFILVKLPSLAALGAVSTMGEDPTVTLDDERDDGPLLALFYARKDMRYTIGPFLWPTSREAIHIRTRTSEGIFKDAAFGGACSALAAYIAISEGREGWSTFEIVHGLDTERQSHVGVFVEVEQGVIKKMVLRARAVKVMEGRVFHE